MKLYKNTSKITQQVKKICGHYWTSFGIEEFILKEDIRREISEVQCTLTMSHRANNKYIINGTGKGMVDALYRSIVLQLSEQYISLKEFKFVSFEIKGNFDGSEIADAATDTKCVAELSIANSRGKIFIFNHEAFSVNSAALGAVRKAIELFVNAELATIKTYQALKEAQGRNRNDLIEKYTSNLADLVNVTCYTDVIEREKNTKETVEVDEK